MISALESEKTRFDENPGLLLGESEIDEGKLPVASEGIARHGRATLLRALDHLVDQVAGFEQKVPAAARRLQALGHAVGENGIVAGGDGLSRRPRLPDFMKAHASREEHCRDPEAQSTPHGSSPLP